MKQFFFLLIALCLPTMLMAQNTLTVSITPNSLKDSLSAEELATVTNLTLTGTMDARDFRTLRDSMPLLSVIDLQNVRIEAFTDTTFSANVLYPANTLPASSPEYGHDYYNNFSLADLPRLTAVTLPSTLVTVGNRAFKGCTGLTSIIIPPSVLSIQGGAFMDCTALTSISLPSSVTYLGKEAFYGCSGLVNADLSVSLTLIREKTFFECTSLTDIKLPPALRSIGYRAFYGCNQLSNLAFPSSLITIQGSAFEGCTALQALAFSSSFTGIHAQAFQGCISLASLSLPRSLYELGSSAFADCRNLKAIYCHKKEPLNLENSPNVFGGVDTSTCLLYIPKGSTEDYMQATQWNDFTHITEMPAFSLSADTLVMEPEGDTILAVIDTELSWTASTDQSWLTLSPSSGTGRATIALTAIANPSVAQQRARVMIVAADTLTQDLILLQKGISKTISLTAGSLKDTLTEEELRTITHLTITGEMDARDFRTLRQQAPFLEMLDLQGVTITAYEGTEGTMDEHTIYPAHELPPMAFIGRTANTAMASLTKVILPSSLTSIGHSAFTFCERLQEINIPEQVTSIGHSAFADCTALTQITLPESLTSLGDNVFRSCTSLRSVTLPPSLTHIAEAMFFNCRALEAVQLPSSISSIGSEAFLRCSSLTSFTIPSSVTTIGNIAFYGCHALTLLEAFPVTPPDLSSAIEVFEGINKNNCILKVPFGSADLYKAAVVWEKFSLVEEIPGMMLPLDSLVMEAERDTAVAEIKANVAWSVSSNQPWLTVSPLTATGNQAITLTAEANPTAAPRSATVIVSGQGIDSDSIYVQQKGITVGVGHMTQNSTIMTCYPNPFTQQVTIEIQNPKREKFIVDIYNLAGQRVKNLVSSNTSELLKISWDGTNEQGQKVPPGVYLCRINHQTKQLVYTGNYKP